MSTSNNKHLAKASAQYLYSGTADPSVQALSAAPGTIYLRLVAGLAKIYQKNDEGKTTNWVLISSGGGGGGGGGAYTPYGSTVAPVIVTPAGLASTADQRQQFFIKSSGGGMPVAGNPQVSPGTIVGQEVRLIGTSDVDYPIFNDGNGMKFNGPISLKNRILIDFYWDGLFWCESNRNN